jgi:hypothetical protein
MFISGRGIDDDGPRWFDIDGNGRRDERNGRFWRHGGNDG